MRFILLLIAFTTTFQCLSQEPLKLLISGIVVNTDSVPIPDVAIINMRSGKVIRTNPNGFFKTEIASKDSLLVYHIAYKNQFIKSSQNSWYIVMEPEIQKL